jgi:hypothetical protein
MAKDINIHVKTTGVEQAKQDFTGLAEEYNSQLTSLRLLQYQATGSTKQHTDELKNQGTVLGGLSESVKNYVLNWLSFTAICALVVSGFRRIIAAADDMRKAVGEAVNVLANQERAAGSFFEAMDAYSGPQRKAALAQARGVQARTGLPFEESKQLLEAQKRTFGEINPEATDQFAAYWKLHAGAQTTDLIRWMGESEITDPQRQGQIMRMIGVVAKQSQLKDEDIITAIAARGERFRYMGWTPEQTITNVGKALSGLSPTEAGKAMRGMFESLEGFTEEKALELKAPLKIAASEQARLEWLQTKAAAMPPEQRRGFLHKIFGPSAPYITKMLFEPTPPEMQKELAFAATPEAAAQARKEATAYRETTEGIEERTAGLAKGFVETKVSREEEIQTALRKYGKEYLEYLKRTNWLEYHIVKLGGIGEEQEYEMAALALYRELYPEPYPYLKQQKLTSKQLLANIEKGEEQQINIHYHNETIYTPRVGSDERGPRAPVNLK